MFPLWWGIHFRSLGSKRQSELFSICRSLLYFNYALTTNCLPPLQLRERMKGKQSALETHTSLHFSIYSSPIFIERLEAAWTQVNSLASLPPFSHLFIGDNDWVSVRSEWMKIFFAEVLDHIWWCLRASPSTVFRNGLLGCLGDHMWYQKSIQGLPCARQASDVLCYCSSSPCMKNFILKCKIYLFKINLNLF